MAANLESVRSSTQPAEAPHAQNNLEKEERSKATKRGDKKRKGGEAATDEKVEDSGKRKLAKPRS